MKREQSFPLTNDELAAEIAALRAAPAMTEETQALVGKARAATTQLRDAARQVMDHRQRDPLVLAIHAALDRLDTTDRALTALARDLETAQRRIDGLWQERESVVAALGLCAGGVGRTLAEEITHQHAAVRAARAETWAEASVAEQVARLAHRGQVDKAGRPYIEHVERVVARVKGDPRAEEVAWLHDVIEDTMFSENMLALFVDDPDTLGAVCTLTRDKEFESYAQYIENVCTSGDPVALKVKLADLRDHLDNAGCPESLRPRYVAALAQVERATAAREGQ